MLRGSGEGQRTGASGDRMSPAEPVQGRTLFGGPRSLPLARTPRAKNSLKNPRISPDLLL